jgi:hypothetical protein
MKRKSQCYLDYAALMIIVGLSLAAMAGYVLNSVSARFRHIKMDLSDPMNGVR